MSTNRHAILLQEAVAKARGPAVLKRLADAKAKQLEIESSEGNDYERYDAKRAEARWEECNKVIDVLDAEVDRQKQVIGDRDAEVNRQQQFVRDRDADVKRLEKQIEDMALAQKTQEETHEKEKSGLEQANQKLEDDHNQERAALNEANTALKTENERLSKEQSDDRAALSKKDVTLVRQQRFIEILKGNVGSEVDVNRKFETIIQEAGME